MQPHVVGPSSIRMLLGGHVTTLVDTQILPHSIAPLTNKAFTVVLHLFGILLALQYPEYGTALCNVSACDVRSTLDRALATLQTVERTSLMSRKARQCMEGFLQVYNSLCKPSPLPPPCSHLT